MCKEKTVSLLNFVGAAGYRLSEKKAQIAKSTVTYLGFKASQGQRKLGNDEKEAICRMALPQSKRKLKGFLGMDGWCHLWQNCYMRRLKALKKS